MGTDTAHPIFLWSYIQNKVYISRSKTLDQLKAAITVEIENGITPVLG